MRKWLWRILARGGRTVTVVRPDGTDAVVTALIEPVRAQAKGAMAFSAAGAGLTGPEQYLYLGPADQPIEGAVIRAEEGEYLVRRAEQLHYGGECIYNWGLLTRSGGDAPWSS